MKTLHIAIISAAMSAFAGVPISRTVDVSATIKPVHLETYAGETLDLSVQLASGGSPLATPSASATIYWQTNGMANAWWQTNMSCSASGLVTGSWSPGLPSGRVWFFVGVESSGLNYRVSGQCSILPSPGGAPSTAFLPPPGGTLNLGDYTIIGAPWITSSDSAAAITSAIAPLSRDIAALSARSDEAATAGSNYTDSVAAPLIAATNSITERLDAIDIPDVSGFASKTSLHAVSNSLAEAVQQSSNALSQATSALALAVAYNAQQSSSDLISATNSLLTSLAPTISAASTALQPSASNALAQATASLAQTVADNAQQSGYDLAAVSNALAQATASLAQTVADNAQQSGYDLAAASNALAQATASLAQTVADNAQQSGYDLAAASNALAQATAALAQTVTDNAQQATSDLVSATNGIPEEITSATNALNQSLAPTISSTSNALAQATTDLAQKVDGLAIITATSNTAYRLMSLDGQTYQDATGTVWHTETTINTSQWHVVAIAYTNGTTVATNEIPGLPSWSIDGDYNGDSDPQWIWTLRVPAGGSEYAQIGGAEAATPADMSLEFPLSGGDISSLLFARTNTVLRYWTPADHVLYASSGGGGSGLTTNDVCNIVTNEVAGFTEWTFSGQSPISGYHWIVLWSNPYWFLWAVDDSSQHEGPPTSSMEGPDDAVSLTFEVEGGTVVATRTRLTRNALGLARLIDLPPLTNGIPVAIAEKASTNDVQLAPVYKGDKYSAWDITPKNYDVYPIVLRLVYYPEDGGAYLWVPTANGTDIGSPIGNLNSTNLTWTTDFAIMPITATRAENPIIGYTLGTQTNKVLASTSITNGLASAGSVSAASAAASAAQTMAAATSNTVASVAGTVAAWETYWDGDEVRVTVTNYDSVVHLPSLYIEQKLENTNAYRTVWDERTRWASNDVQMAEMRSAIDEKADRAWGFYDSHTGEYAPDGYTWLSSPKIAIAGGLAYQRTLTTSGAIWVLVSNGLVAQTGGDTNGFFRIKDDEGNTTFELVRGNKRTVGATAAGIKVTSPRNSPTVTIEIPYNVVSDASPTLYGTANLSSPEWTQLSPQWLGQSGAWTAIVTSASSQYFVKGEYEVGGETYIKNIAPISVESGIYCTDGVHKVRPVYNNGTITWEVVQ